MKKTIAIGVVSVLLTATAHAATPQLLKTGDILDVQEGVTLTKWSVREVLREYGYTNFGPGALRGNIISITAYGPDKNRYEIRVHWKTHIVTRIIKPRNFWY